MSVIEEELIDKKRIEFTINTREDIIKSLIKEGAPTDSDDRMFLIKLLDGMDRSVFTKAKMKNDSKALDNQRNVTNIIASVLNRVSINTNGVNNNNTDLDSSIIVEDLLEGELTMGKQLLDHNTFFSEDE
jgi:hypothetical protein